MKALCIVCHKEFDRSPSCIRGGTCSKACGYLIRKRPTGLKYKIKKKNKGWFKSGCVPHNKGDVSFYESEGYLRNGADGKRQHRQIVEDALGRKLKRKEVVHHINGDTTDNRLENLQYFRNASAHISLHWFTRRHNLDMSLFKTNWQQIYGKT